MSRPASRSWFSKKKLNTTRKEDAVRRMMRMETLETRCVLAASYADSNVMVLFKPSATPAEIATVTGPIAGKPIEKLTLHAAPADYGQFYRFELKSGLSMGNALSVLRSNPLVKIAEADGEAKPALISNDTHYLNGELFGMYSSPAAVPGLQNTFGSQADTLWAQGQVGNNNVVIGIIDTGIDLNHPDLAANIWTNPGEIAGNGIDDDNNGYIDDMHGWDFANNDNSIFDGQAVGDGRDDHGTHVAGTIGAVGGNGIGVAGVNWNVKMISAKFLDPSGAISNAVLAMDYFTALKQRGVNLVGTNNSWQGGGFSQLMLDAIGRGADEELLFIVCAGNFNLDTDATAFYPANYNTLDVTDYDAVIAVAAIDEFGNRASFSNYGATNIELGAPGVAVRSTTPFNTYADFDGTSMASPHVAGGAALYFSTHPTATAQEIKDVLLGSAVQTPTASLSGATRVITQGRLNLTKLTPAPPPALPKISIGNATIVEGDHGFTYASLTLTLDRALTSQARVRFTTADNLALAGSDYVSTTGNVIIPPGQTTATVKIPVYGDTLLEPNETFFVNLSNPVNIDIDDGQGVVTIQNDDFATKVSVEDVRRLEGHSGYSLLVFNVMLSQASASNVVVRLYTNEGSAKDGMDFIGIPALAPVTVTFLPGELVKTVTVRAIGETLFEPDEEFYLDILSATNSQIRKARGVGTILNDDSGAPGLPPMGGPPSTGPNDSGGLDGLGIAMYLSSLNGSGSSETTKPAAKKK